MHKVKFWAYAVAALPWVFNIGLFAFGGARPSLAEVGTLPS